MFHVEPKSHASFASFNQTLKQRNYLLKTKNYKDIDFWNNELVENNTDLFHHRSSYYSKLSEEFKKIIIELKDALPDIYGEIESLDMSYYKGWDNEDYVIDLENTFEKDKSVGYTTVGTHRS